RERRAGLRSAFAPGAEVPELFVEDLRRTSYEAYLNSTNGFDAYLAACSSPDRVRELGIRTLVIFGVEDRRVDAAGIDAFDQLGNATVERLPDVGHSPMWEAPDDVAALLERAAT